MELPKPLQTWSGELNLFRTDVALTLGETIRRLALAIGPMFHVLPLSGGEPEGFDGISARGSYEHLLCGEWLLADEWPNEFMRRAAMGEHLFLRRAFQEPSTGRHSVVLFDTGPYQMGVCRIAQLALLILFHRRATMAGADFAWGFLQWPDVGLKRRLDEAAIQGFLAGLSWSRPTSSHLNQWRRILAEEPTDDLWSVGSPLVAGCLDSPRWVVISEQENPDDDNPLPQHLQVTVHRAGTTTKLNLSLPDQESSAQILTDPFPMAPYVASYKDHRSFVVYEKFNRAVVLGSSGDATIVPIPSSPKGQMQTIHRYCPPKDHQLIAVGFANKNNLFLTLSSTSIYCYGLPHKGPQRWNKKGNWNTSRRQGFRQLQPLSYLKDEEGHFLLVPDYSGNLIRLSIGGSCTIIQEHVSSMIEMEGIASWVSHKDLKRNILISTTNSGTTRFKQALRSERVFFGRGYRGELHAGLMLVFEERFKWRQYHGKKSELIEIPDGYQPVGVNLFPPRGHLDSSFRGKPVVILLDDAGKKLVLLFENEITPITESTHAIAEIHVHHLGGRIFWRCKKGHFNVWSLRHSQQILRVGMEEFL